MEIPRHWRLKKQRYGLVGNECPRCEKKSFPPTEICRRCQEFDEERSKDIVVYDANSGLLFSPNNQVVHSEVVREN